MINHRNVRLALRAKILTLAVCSTGTMALEATATGYKRASGDFFADGFCKGMEVTPSGFTQTDLGVISDLSDTEMEIDGGRTVQASGSGRSLAVVLPSSRSWENVSFDPTEGVPYISEEYLPGPTEQVTLGPLGEIEGLPMYLPRVYMPVGVGSDAGDAYADALLSLFAPRTSITLSDGSLQVRSQPAPYRGQAIFLASGFSVIPVTVPLRLRTANAI